MKSVSNPFGPSADKGDASEELSSLLNNFKNVVDQPMDEINNANLNELGIDEVELDEDLIEWSETESEETETLTNTSRTSIVTVIEEKDSSDTLVSNSSSEEEICGRELGISKCFIPKRGTNSIARAANVENHGYQTYSSGEKSLYPEGPIVMPEPFRLAFVPFASFGNPEEPCPNSSRKTLANVADVVPFYNFWSKSSDTNAIRGTISVLNNQEKYGLAFMFTPSNRNKFSIHPDLGFMGPGQNILAIVKVFDHLTFSSIQNEWINVYVAPVKIIKTQPTDAIPSWSQITDIHAEDFWSSFGTIWFPKVEVYKLTKFEQNNGPISIYPSYPYASPWNKAKEYFRNFRASFTYNVPKDIEPELTPWLGVKNLRHTTSSDRGKWKFWKLLVCFLDFVLIIANYHQVISEFGIEFFTSREFWTAPTSFLIATLIEKFI